jgi:hypothetical protein
VVSTKWVLNFENIPSSLKGIAPKAKKKKTCAANKGDHTAASFDSRGGQCILKT